MLFRASLYAFQRCKELGPCTSILASGGKRFAQKEHTILTGRTIRLPLFDLGETLWTRTGKTTWRVLEEAANQRAVAILHEHIASTALLTTNSAALASDYARRWKQNFTL